MEYQNLLFLCSGNYYRSRFAEAVFNHLAVLDCLHWRATSRGLKAKAPGVGLSPCARDYLLNLRIPLGLTAEEPAQVTESDLVNSSLVVAVYEAEHRPMIARLFPHWENRVAYWQIPDVDITPHEEALPDLENEVRDLYELIKDGCARGCGDAMAMEF